MSHVYSTLSIGQYIAMTIVPLICLAVWGVAMYRADKQPEWRLTQREQGPPQIPGAEARVGRSLPGSFPVPAEQAPRTENQPD